MAGGAIPDILPADLQEARKDEAKDAESRQREEEHRIHKRLISGEGVGQDDASKSAPRIDAHDAPRIDSHDAPRIDSPDAPRIDAHDAREVAAVKREAAKQVEKIESQMPKADNVI
jgi:hypothetical protein